MSKFDNYCGSGPLYWIQQQRGIGGCRALDPPPKSPIGPIYAFPELFRGQILAIHILTFGKIFRRAILTTTFAFSKISQQISGLVLSGEYISREEVRPIFQVADLAI